MHVTNQTQKQQLGIGKMKEGKKRKKFKNIAASE